MAPTMVTTGEMAPFNMQFMPQMASMAATNGNMAVPASLLGVVSTTSTMPTSQWPNMMPATNFGVNGVVTSINGQV